MNHLLRQVECKSYRGIAPVGESICFVFDKKTNLIYGPNGSGKTSLLGAVNWVLTGQAVSDSHEPYETAPVYQVPKSDGKGKKITDWSIVATLPDGEITSDTTQECSVQIELVSSDGSTVLNLRRSIADGFEFRLNDEDWGQCSDLTLLGIEALDLQLSLHAPTTFGRFTVENAPDTKSLLSLMLGFDDLENLGELASNISGNRTRLANQEKTTITKAWIELTERLGGLPARLPESHDARQTFDDLKKLAKKVGKKQLTETAEEISGFIEQAENSLATILGLEVEGVTGHSDLSDKLTSSVLKLEKGVWENFPLLGQLRLDSVFPSSDHMSSKELLESSALQLTEFISDATGRIEKRLAWWREESKADSKATLLLQVAKYYQPAHEDCPVCERSIKDMSVKDELIRLNSLDAELRETTKNFFRNLSGELDIVIPNLIRELAKQSPKERISNDWEELSNKSLPDEFLPIIEKFNPQIKSIANGLSFSEPEPRYLLPDGTEEEFVDVANDFCQKVEFARIAITTLQWSESNLNNTHQKIHTTVTSLEDDSQSLLSMISVGKGAATAIAPLKALHKEIIWAIKKRQDITRYEEDHSLLVELESPLNRLKLLKKYAESQVGHIFEDIHKDTISNWRTMYPETSSGLSPARLLVGKGRDKSVTAFLSKGDYEVPEQFFGNAGLQRAVALAFYFALLEKHPRGLGFVRKLIFH